MLRLILFSRECIWPEIVEVEFEDDEGDHERDICDHGDHDWQELVFDSINTDENESVIW